MLNQNFCSMLSRSGKRATAPQHSHYSIRRSHRCILSSACCCAYIILSRLTLSPPQSKDKSSSWDSASAAITIAQMAEPQGSLAHAELIDALTELYTLLDTLGALPGPDSPSPSPSPSPNANANVCLPPHPAGSINAEAAAAAGFAAEAISLMSALPFLADEHAYNHGSGCQLMPSTYAVSYLGEDMDEGGFEARRGMLYDNLMPSTALKLTQSDVYGVEWAYDVGTSKFDLFPFVFIFGY